MDGWKEVAESGSALKVNSEGQHLSRCASAMTGVVCKGSICEHINKLLLRKTISLFLSRLDFSIVCPSCAVSQMVEDWECQEIKSGI